MVLLMYHIWVCWCTRSVYLCLALGADLACFQHHHDTHQGVVAAKLPLCFFHFNLSIENPHAVKGAKDKTVTLAVSSTFPPP